MSDDRALIRGLLFYGYHGVVPEESPGLALDRRHRPEHALIQASTVLAQG